MYILENLNPRGENVITREAPNGEFREMVILARSGRAGEFSPVTYLVEDEGGFVTRVKTLVDAAKILGVGDRISYEMILIAWLRNLESSSDRKPSEWVAGLDGDRAIRVFGESIPFLSPLIRNVRSGWAK